MARQDLSVPVNPIRDCTRTSIVYQGDGSGSTTTQANGHSIVILSRRYMCSGQIEGSSASTWSNTEETLTESRFPFKRNKMLLDTETNTTIPRLLIGYSEDGDSSSKRKDPEDKEGYEATVSSRRNDDQETGSHHGVITINSSSRVPIEIPDDRTDQTDSSSPTASPKHQPQLGLEDLDLQRNQRVSKVVDQQPSSLERQIDDPRTSRDCHRNRRQRLRVGLCRKKRQRRYPYRGTRTLASTRRPKLHQLERTQSSGDSYRPTCDFMVEEDDTDPFGQYDDMFNCQSTGEQTTPAPAFTSQQTGISLRSQQDPSVCEVSTWEGEYNSRSFESEDNPPTARATPTSTGFSVDRGNVWETHNRSLCQQPEQSTANIHINEPRQPGNCNRRDELQLANEGVCLPSVAAHQSDLGQNTTESCSRAGPGYTTLDNATLVARADILSNEKSTNAPIKKFTGMAHLNLSGLDAQTKEVIHMAKKPRTVASYGSYMKRYEQWCQGQGLDPQATTWQQRLMCLNHQVQANELTTRSIINMRSAISMNTPLINGTAFGQLPVVQAFIKGLRRKRPILPKSKQYQWHVIDLIRHLKAMSPWEKLSLIDKGRKTHALLCLATGWRPASDFHRTLASVDFQYDQGRDGPVSLILTATDVKEGGNKSCVPIPRLFEEVDLCPVMSTWRYLVDTKDIRPLESMFLFIRTTEPYGALSGDRLSNWLKGLMAEAGIPAHVLPHSIRAVSTSTAWDAGMSVNDIMACANWSKASTFENFYHLRRN